jgi:Domain of unknown function (DUF4365)
MQSTSTRQELLSRAFVTAIAAHAGIKCVHIPDQDVGTDGHFKLVRKLTTRRTQERTDRQGVVTEVPIELLREWGPHLDFQLKASINCTLRPTTVTFKAKPDDYDKLVDPENTMTSILLIVCALPRTEPEWLLVEEDFTRLGGRCFYHFVPTGLLTDNTGSVTITIPRVQLLNPGTLNQVMLEHIARNGRRKN